MKKVMWQQTDQLKGTGVLGETLYKEKVAI